jgi:hypothetical protein
VSHLRTRRALALAALVTAACGTNLPRFDPFPLTPCVLQGSAVADGCATDPDGNPVIIFGTVGFGRTASNVVSLTSAFKTAGAEVTEVKLSTGAPANVQLAVFTLDAGSEVPATLPFALAPRESPPNDELRVRVSFVADPPGALSGVALEVTSGGKATSLPISAEGLDRVTKPFPGVACSGDPSCSVDSVDICTYLPDLRTGDAFTVAYSNIGSCWSTDHVSTATFTRGAIFTHEDATSGEKRNTTALVYDGDCALTGYSAYSGKDTECSRCVLQVTALAYAIP